MRALHGVGFGGRVRRFVVRAKEGESFGEEGNSLFGVEAKKMDSYLGRMTFRKCSTYC